LGQQDHQQTHFLNAFLYLIRGAFEGVSFFFVVPNSTRSCEKEQVSKVK
jgi:hypothetical protein